MPDIEIPARNVPQAADAPATTGRSTPTLDADDAVDIPERKTPSIGPPPGKAGFWAGMKRKRKKVAQGGAHFASNVAIALLLIVLGLTVVPVAMLRVVPAYTSSFMLRYQFERIGDGAELPPLQHHWVAWDDISRMAKLSVLASEDQRFPHHHGLDFEAIEKAIEHNQRSNRKRGASTITQQVAKNLFLSPRRSWTRKGLEVGYTMLIELMWPKRRILEVYLNVAEFGPGVYGVEAAAQKYFGKPAARLTSYEAALMAAVLPNPRRLQLGAPSEYVRGRANAIHGQMNRLGTGYLKGL